MSGLLLSFAYFIAVCFLAYSVILTFRFIISKEQIKMQSEKILLLDNVCKEQCEQIKQAYKRQKEIDTLRGYISKHITQLQTDDIQSLIQQVQFDNRNWEQLVQYINITQNNFVKKLMIRYPSLTNEDIHTIMLMRIGMSNSEIADFYNILLPSLSTKRHRIIKKMGVQINGSTTDFIRDLFKDEC